MRPFSESSPQPNNGSPGGPGQPLEQSEERAAPIKLGNVLNILWRRLWLIGLCTFLGLAVGWLFLRNTTPVYKSTSRVYVDRTGPMLVRQADVDMLLRASNFRRTQAEIVGSLSVLAKVPNNPTLKASGLLEVTSNPLAFIKQGLDVTVGQDDLLYVSFEAKAPETAAKIANAVVESYVEFNSESRRSTNAEIIRILQKEKEKQDADFSARLHKLTEFRIANGDLALSEAHAASPILSLLGQYTDALARARLDGIEAQAVFDAASALKDDTQALQQFLQNRSGRNEGEPESAKVRRIRDQIDQVSVLLSDLERQYTANHPQVVSTRQRLTALQETLATAERDYRTAVLAAMKQSVDLSQARVGNLETLVAEQRQKAEGVNSNLAQLELLQAEYSQSKQMVEILNARLKELNIGDDAGAMNVLVLEPAVPSSEPSWPVRSKVLRFALAFGLLAGLVAALALEVIDDRLRSADVATQALGLPVLGVVPATYKEADELGRLVHHDPKTPFAEVFRTIRTGIFFGAAEGQRRSIVVTSPLPGDGKTSIAANLAEAFAQVGHRTILLDCDFRKPRVHQIFNLPHETGLSSIITGQSTLEDTLQRGVFEELDVLTCGPTPPNPAELLNSAAFRELLAKLSKIYEHVVIDSPPVLAVADARIVAAMADLTILVIRADKTRRRPARHACEQLASVGAAVLGMVINGAPRHTQRYGYGQGYYAYHYYGDKPDAPQGSAKEQPAAEPALAPTP